jgi:hypothetical protein
LSVKVFADGGVWPTCYAGCPVEQILAPLELTKREIAAHRSRASDPIDYWYRDAHDRELFVIRRNGTEKWTAHRDANGEIVKDAGTDQRPLYRLSEVLGAIERGATIYLCEGESDADAVRARGVVATTNPFGARAWRAQHADVLAKAAHVVVIGDDDRAGHAGLRTRVAALRTRGVRADAVLPAEGKDVRDHLSSGRTLDELRPLPDDEPAAVANNNGVGADATPDDGNDADDRASYVLTRAFSTIAPERVTWLWPGWLPRGKVVVLDGDPDLGKSTLAIDLAARLSTRSPMPDDYRPDRKLRTAVLTAEDGMNDTVVPRFLAAGGDGDYAVSVDGIVDEIEHGGTIVRGIVVPRDVPALEERVGDLHIDLLIIDVFVAFLDYHLNSHNDAHVRAVLMALANMTARTNAVVKFLRHLNKTLGGNPLYRGGGSIGIIGAARAGWVAALDPNDETKRVLAVTKSNLAAKPQALSYSLVPAEKYGCARVAWHGTANYTANELLNPTQDTPTKRERTAKWLRDYLAERGQVRQPTIVEAAEREIDVSIATLKRAKADCKDVDSVKIGLDWYWFLTDADEHTT